MGTTAEALAPRERLITPPNLLALSRIPLGLAFWGVAERQLLSLITVGVAGATDVMDGWLARRLRLARPGGIGTWLDPACDKFFVLSVLSAVYARRGASLALVTLIAAREIVLVPLVVVHRLVPALRGRLPRDFSAGALGKATTAAQFSAVGALLAGHPAATPLAWAACGIGLLAAARYLARARALRRGGSADEP